MVQCFTSFMLCAILTRLPHQIARYNSNTCRIMCGRDNEVKSAPHLKDKPCLYRKRARHELNTTEKVGTIFRTVDSFQAWPPYLWTNYIRKEKESDGNWVGRQHNHNNRRHNSRTIDRWNAWPCPTKFGKTSIVNRRLAGSIAGTSRTHAVWTRSLR